MWCRPLVQLAISAQCLAKARLWQTAVMQSHRVQYRAAHFRQSAQGRLGNFRLGWSVVTRAGHRVFAARAQATLVPLVAFPAAVVGGLEGWWTRQALTLSGRSCAAWAQKGPCWEGGGIWATSDHACHGMRFVSWSALRDASHCMVVNKDGRVRGLEGLALQGVESQRGADAKQLIVYLRWVGQALLLASTATFLQVPTFSVP